MKWKIGNVEIKNQVVLAPMAGVSDPAYIKICEEFGVGYAVTELISSEAIIRDNKKTFDMLNGIDKINIPIAVQIFGSNPDTMASAAKILTEKFKIKIVDINMGCPVPKVAQRSNSGSALLKDPKLVFEIVSKVVQTVDIPVTVKIRSGWDSNSINAVEIAKTIEKAGASAIAIHARTRSQQYSGSADWNIIKQVKENVSIPVIGNGDVKSCFDLKKMIEYTNCDAVMIGRALLGNPWLVRDCVNYLENGIEPIKVSVFDKIEMIKKHLDYLMKIKSEHIAITEIRSHAAWYLKGISNTVELKKNIFKCKTYDEVVKLLNEFEGDL